MRTTIAIIIARFCPCEKERRLLTFVLRLLLLGVDNSGDAAVAALRFALIVRAIANPGGWGVQVAQRRWWTDMIAPAIVKPWGRFPGHAPES